MNLIEARNINKNYHGHIALSDLSLNVKRGSIYGLLGPNGAGKTTFIRILNQIIKQDSGSIYFDGEELSARHIYQIGYMPEERGLYRNMKVGDQALYLAQLKGMDLKEARLRLEYWFEKFEITSWWNKKIQELSKGMAQKIQFIVTVLHEPKLLIFDEPFSGFDPVNANVIKDEIINLKEKGSTILFSTHRMESVEEMCDHIALIYNSKKVLEGEIAKIKRNHRDDKYDITVNSSDVSKISALGSRVEIIREDFNKNFHDQKDLTLKINNGMTSQELLSNLTQIGELHHFTERIPSINDIFIQEVAKASNQ